MHRLTILSRDPLKIAEDEALFAATCRQWRRRVLALEGDHDVDVLYDEFRDFIRVIADAAQAGTLSRAAYERIYRAATGSYNQALMDRIEGRLPHR